VVDRQPVEREAEEPAQMPKTKVAPSWIQVFAILMWNQIQRASRRCGKCAASWDIRVERGGNYADALNLSGAGTAQMLLLSMVLPTAAGVKILRAGAGSVFCRIKVAILSAQPIQRHAG